MRESTASRADLRAVCCCGRARALLSCLRGRRAAGRGHSSDEARVRACRSDRGDGRALGEKEGRGEAAARAHLVGSVAHTVQARPRSCSSALAPEQHRQAHRPLSAQQGRPFAPSRPRRPHLPRGLASLVASAQHRLAHPPARRPLARARTTSRRVHAPRSAMPPRTKASGSASSSTATSTPAWTHDDDDALTAALEHGDGQLSWHEVATIAFPDGKFNKTECNAVSLSSSSSSFLLLACCALFLTGSRAEPSHLQRWTSLSRPKTIKGSWTAAEDAKLVELVDEFGSEKWVRRTVLFSPVLRCGTLLN